MLFNSLAFALFLPISLVLYWSCARRLKAQNIVLVALSYVFYGFWDWRFLSLLVASTVIDFYISNALAESDDSRRRKLLLAGSVVANLGILGFFKYFNFFIHSLERMLSMGGVEINTATLHIILPVGISFYTFQTMSYTIDVYRRQLEPTRNIVALGAYVSFFPQLVAGPIERGTHLLPQMLRPRSVDAWAIRQGMWLLILGFLRKSVIADNAAFLVERVYDRPGDVGAGSLLVATVAFAVQIYGDFAGYSNMARGVALLFGFDIMVNFRAPYASRSIQEFWRRWHISLSSWLRDYLYVPLGGNKKGSVRTYVNLMTTMLLGGLWHGAAWNFVIWGGWQGLGLVFHRLFFRSRKPDTGSSGMLLSARSAVTWTLTFAFVLQGWLLFRVRGLDSIVLLSEQWLRWGEPLLFTSGQCLFVLVSFLAVVALDLVESRDYENLVVARVPRLVQVFLGSIAILVIVLLGSFREQPFLYFQF